MWTANEIRNYKIRDEHDHAIFRAYGMFRDRANYYKDDLFSTNYGMKCAYENVCTILEYAMTDDWAGLNQFDYFGEEN